MPDWVKVLPLFCCRACELGREEAAGGSSTIKLRQTGLRFYPYSVAEPVNWVWRRSCWVGTSTITPRQTGLRFYLYSVVEPVNWVQEKLLGE